MYEYMSIHVPYNLAIHADVTLTKQDMIIMLCFFFSTYLILRHTEKDVIMFKTTEL
jgi:hypothetical protein